MPGLPDPQAREEPLPIGGPGPRIIPRRDVAPRLSREERTDRRVRDAELLREPPPGPALLVEPSRLGGLGLVQLAPGVPGRPAEPLAEDSGQLVGHRDRSLPPVAAGDADRL